MHPHLFDWFRNVHIKPDPTVVEQRWKVASTFGQKLSRGSILRLLGLFLFPTPDTAEVKWLTEEFLALDGEFPVTNNAEEVRLMAGVVMSTTFDQSSSGGDAFALGLRSAAFQRTI